MTVLLWLPIVLLLLIGSDVAGRLSLHLPPGSLLGLALLGLCAGWAARPWQPPAHRRQVRACGLSVGLLYLHVGLGGMERVMGLHIAELLTVCILIALWLPHRPRKKRNRKVVSHFSTRTHGHNRAIPLS